LCISTKRMWNPSGPRLLDFSSFQCFRFDIGSRAGENMQRSVRRKGLSGQAVQCDSREGFKMFPAEAQDATDSRMPVR
jgi:hypothetical protein